MSTSDKIKNMLTWGFLLWLAGYIAGIVLFFIVPKSYIGWVLTPLATVFTVWVLIKKVRRPEMMCYFGTGLVWTVMAVLLDYLFMVTFFIKAGSSYYKPDVFLYYLLTFTLPILVGYWKFKHKSPKANLF